MPDWFNQSADLAELDEKTGIDADGLARTLGRWNAAVADEVDPDFGLGTKGGPRTDRDGWVRHVNGKPIPGLYAAATQWPV